ncbi:hypothetical protein Q9L58_008546 [Maublancomyces gigas]|uniref:Tafazzin n=1 Tax=Discina gigas TaxID=1032678 RepID=A0ABR3G9F7_9PEZI
MPKKRHLKFLKPSSNLPSNAASSSFASSVVADHTSVNDLLAHLRVSQPSTEPPRPPISTLPSVPPSLQQILANAEPPLPPRPRVQLGVSRRNRIPGPPPPASWLVPGADGNPSNEHEERIYKVGYRGEDIYEFPDPARIEPHRLARLTLVAMAREWSFHIVYDQHYLYTLRPGLKSALLAYIAAYNPDGVGINGLRVLFKDGPSEDDGGGWEAEAETSSNEDVKHMDLTRALGPRLPWKDLCAFFHQHQPPGGATGKLPHVEEPTQDAWDLSPAPPRNRFSSLTHISLSHPHPTMASWSRLTIFTRFIPTITHLSLAGWSLPASVEPAGVLKRFARGLLCLKWLDVRDCNAEFYETLMEVEWDRCWRGVETVVCSQGGETPEWVAKERGRAAEELKKCIRAVRQEMGGKWCSVVV